MFFLLQLPSHILGLLWGYNISFKKTGGFIGIAAQHTVVVSQLSSIGCKCMCIITIKDSSFSLLYWVTFSLLIANKGFHFFLHSRVSSKNNQNLYAWIDRCMLAFISGSNATSNERTFTQFYVDQSNDQSNFDKIW